MYAFIRIGDATLTIVESHLLHMPEAHQITAQDTWESHLESGKLSTIIVPTEHEAVDVLADFMQKDGPTGPFLKYFPDQAP